MAHLRAEDDRRIRGDEVVKAGDVIRVTYRDVTIIDGYWDFQYTRNPGAAFGFLASSDSPLRRPFFVGVSALAILIILYVLVGVQLHQQLLIWGLSLIASGAVGNFIDRVRFGYVIDFILWKYTDAHRWPTFNIADALICVGVGFMVLEIIRDSLAQRREAKLAGASQPDDAPASDESPHA
jgi:lipoprotein signal peptidase